MIDLSKLNSQQLLAVKNIYGPMLILAGAGTGKTNAITYRIAHMVNQGIAPDKIVAVTFTNKAAREMKNRVERLIGAKARDLKLGTFHSVCLEILRKYAKIIDLPQRFQLISQGDQIDLVRRVLEEKKGPMFYRPQQLHYLISLAKNNLILPSNIKEFLSTKYQKLCQSHYSSRIKFREIFTQVRNLDYEEFREIYDLYERQLKVNRSIDFDDCILKTYYLLSERKEVKQALHEKWQFVLVDEYQDTNFAQLSFLRELVSDNQNICAVGDDDQSIYSWRGAFADNLEMFEKIFTNTNIVKLEQNYRSTNIILQAANSVIKHNLKRKPKTLWSQSKAENLLSLVSKENELEEARWIAQKCLSYLGRGQTLKDIAILYRTGGQSKAIEMTLREHRLSYKVFGGQSFFEKKEVRDFLAYLKLIHDPQDRLAFYRIINTPPRGMGIKTLEQIEALSTHHRRSPFQILESNIQVVPHKSQQLVQQFVAKIKTLHAFLIKTPEDLEELGKRILKEFALEQNIRQKVKDQNSVNIKIELLRRLPLWLADSLPQDKWTPAFDLGQFIDQLLLNDDYKKEHCEHNDEFISCMTIHAAKGLEFPVVFFGGLEEDIIPHKNSLLEHRGIEEERRLFYVGLTRAKEFLHLSYAESRQGGFNNMVSRKPSRFLKELPSHCISVIDESKELDIKGLQEQNKRNTLRKLDLLKKEFVSRN